MGGGTAVTLESNDEDLGDLASTLENGVESDELNENRPDALAGMLESHKETYTHPNNEETLLVPEKAAHEVEEEYHSILESAKNKNLKSNIEFVGAAAGFLGTIYGSLIGNYSIAIGSFSSGSGLLALSRMENSESEDFYKELNSYEAEISEELTNYQLEE